MKANEIMRGSTYPLFQHMSEEHGLTLTESELNEIVRAALKTQSGLIEFAEGQAYCPCCEGIRECHPDCTISEDCASSACHETWERIVSAREALSNVPNIHE